MTTVIDPSGTHTVVYNRSGTTIITMAGGNSGVTSSNPNVPAGNDGIDIPRFSDRTVVLGDTTPGGTDFVYRLPAGAELGDIVEVYPLGNGKNAPVVFPQIGEKIQPNAVVSTGTNNAAAFGTGPHVGCFYRKVSSDTWVAIGNP